MPHKTLAVLSCQRMIPAKDDVMTNRVGIGVNQLRAALRGRICVDAHRAKVVAETRAHEAASDRVQWLTRRAQHVIYDRGNKSESVLVGGLTLQYSILALA